MKKIIASLLIILLLPGCLPTVFIVGAAAGGSVIYDHRKTTTMVEDRDITFQTQNKISQNKELREQTHISIVTFNHIALLLGQAPNEELRSRAESIAKSNSKVKMLYNEITIEKPTSNTVRANDSWITTKIKTVLLTASGLSSTNLKVVTENGAVYLMGLTTHTQAQIATDKTRTVAGVKKVVKLFEYLN